MNTLTLCLSLLLTSSPAGQVTFSVSPEVPPFLRKSDLIEIERVLRKANGEGVWVFRPDEVGDLVRGKYPYVISLPFGPEGAAGSDLEDGTLVIFAPGKALTSAHSVEPLNHVILNKKVIAKCRTHPCFKKDAVTGTGKQWDLAYCEGEALKAEPPNVNELSFDFKAEPHKEVAIVGYGCNAVDVTCPATPSDLDKILAAAKPSPDPSMARLFVSDRNAPGHPILHRTLVQMRPSALRCTVVCNGDSGGAVFFPSDSRKVVGIISQYDKNGNSYFTLLDEVTKKWLGSPETFDVALCN